PSAGASRRSSGVRTPDGARRVFGAVLHHLLVRSWRLSFCLRSHSQPGDLCLQLLIALLQRLILRAPLPEPFDGKGLAAANRQQLVAISAFCDPVRKHLLHLLPDESDLRSSLIALFFGLSPFIRRAAQLEQPLQGIVQRPDVLLESSVRVGLPRG